MHPLGAPFTLSPENYGYWKADRSGAENQYLGYSLEPSCLKTPYVPFGQRPRQAYVFAKFLQYFLRDDYILRSPSGHIISNFFERLAKVGGITFLGHFKRSPANIEPPDSQPPPGIIQHPKLDRPAFQKLVSNSRVLMGVGFPLLSPTPWEALCLGVPVINPIRSWDKDDPDNREKWEAQQDGLLTYGLDEPFVYHVKLGDEVGLERAIRKAMETPIER